MSGKNGGIITKTKTNRLRRFLAENAWVFGLYEWVFVRMILKLILFLTKFIA